MNLGDLKHWIDDLPEEFLEYSVVFSTFKKLDELYTARMDSPVNIANVDEDNKEIILCYDDLDNSEDTEYNGA